MKGTKLTPDQIRVVYQLARTVNEDMRKRLLKRAKELNIPKELIK